MPATAAAARDCNIDIDPMPDTDPPNITPSLRDLYANMQTHGFLQAISDWIAPHMEPGSAGRRAVDKTGMFNVNQSAVEIPTGLPGVSGKFGVQINIVKPDIFPHTSDYHLQIFPSHDEIGFNLPQFLTGDYAEDLLPDWCGVSAQIIRNHGFNVPITHKDGHWSVAVTETEYLEEWVIRPTELDLKYLGTPAQATIGLELGMHFKWEINNPNTIWALGTNAIANAIGAGFGLIAATPISGNPMLFMQVGAMTAQLLGHGLQCQSSSLRPDTVVAWAGATFSAADLNIATQPAGFGRITEYPRIWIHAYDGCWKLGDLRQQAEAAVAPIIERNRQDQAIELAELGIDNPGFRPGTRLSTISENYAAQQ